MSFFLCSATVFFLAACGTKKLVYQKKYDLAEQQWVHSDTLNYDFTIADTLKIYDLVLEVEHAPSYSFQNLYVRIHTQFPTGERTQEKVSLELADAAGKWQGNAHSDWIKTPIAIQTGAYFNRKGKYTLTVEQFMRTDTLSGIKSVALQVEDTEKKRN